MLRFFKIGKKIEEVSSMAAKLNSGLESVVPVEIRGAKGVLYSR